MEPITTSVSFPRMIINVEYAGTNSLVGSLCVKLIENNHIRNVGVLHPDEIVFVINYIHPSLNLYEEINKVRDILKIPEDKITVHIERN